MAGRPPPSHYCFHKFIRRFYARVAKLYRQAFCKKIGAFFLQMSSPEKRCNTRLFRSSNFDLRNRSRLGLRRVLGWSFCGHSAVLRITLIDYTSQKINVAVWLSELHCGG